MTEQQQQIKKLSISVLPTMACSTKHATEHVLASSRALGSLFLMYLQVSERGDEIQGGITFEGQVVHDLKEGHESRQKDFNLHFHRDHTTSRQNCIESETYRPSI